MFPSNDQARAARGLAPTAKFFCPSGATAPTIGWIAAMMLLVVALGCDHAASSTTAQGNPTAEDEEVPITAADVPMPANYADAVKRLVEYRDSIQEAVSTRHFHDAHRPLDETNIALERLPAIARASGVPAREWETIVEAGDDLGEALNLIHEAIDAGQSPDFNAQAKAIDDALARLQAVQRVADDQINSADTDHERISN